MNVRHALVLLGLGAAATVAWAQPAARETNFWPGQVRYENSTNGEVSWTGAGPFLFRKAADAEGNIASGFRPFWVQLQNRQGELRAGYFLYPLFSYTLQEDTYRWSVFELVRSWGRRASAGAPT